MAKIHDAIRKGDLPATKRLLTGGFLRRPADPNEKDSSGYGPMTLALSVDHIDIAKLLAEMGGHVDATGPEGETDLFQAVDNGDVKLAELLLEWGAKVNIRVHQETLLHLAAKGGHVALTKLFIEKGLDIAATNRIGKTALQLASEGGHLELAKLLIEKGAIPGPAGPKLLHTAVQKDEVEFAELLIKKDVEINQYIDGETPLHRAVGQGNIRLVKLLIERGADISAAGKDGNSPLFYAFRRQGDYHLDAAQFLLAAGADVNARNTRGWRPIHVASGNTDPGGVKFLLEHGADPRIAADDGTTPLHQASGMGHTEVIKLLLAAGADANTKDRDGWSPLSAAQSLGRRDVVSILNCYKPD